MAEDKTVYGAKASRVAQLLGLGAEGLAVGGGQVSEQQQKADLLHDLLASKIVMEDAPITEFDHALNSAMSESNEHYLLHRDTSLVILQRIKAKGASLGRSANSAVESEPAHVIYYAAIAAALVNHGQRITEFTSQELKRSFTKFLALSWITPALKTLFNQAMEVCRKRASSPGSHE